MNKTYINLELSLIKPFDRNPRKNDDAVDKVVESINKFGYINPIIVDENNVILAGHTRYKALQKILTKDQSIIKVLKIEGLTDEQKKKYRIYDNKLGEIAEWNIDMLKADFEVAELEEFGFSFDDNQDFSEKNKEVDVNGFADEMKIVLNYTEEEYFKVIEQLKKIAQTPEQAVWKLLGNE